MNTPNLLPIGRIAVQIQSPLADIRRAAAAAGVEPALSLNGVLYFSEVDVEKIDAHLRRRASSIAGPMHPPEILQCRKTPPRAWPRSKRSRRPLRSSPSDSTTSLSISSYPTRCCRR